MVLECPHPRRPGDPGLLKSLDRQTISAGVVAALFATTGPLALILTVGRSGGLSEDEIIGWIFAGYLFGGILSVGFSTLYRTPIGLAWSIPGTAMLLAALHNLSFAEAVGAYLVCGVLMTFLGISGCIGWLTERIPVAIVMGMVAGVFLPIGLGLVEGFVQSPLLAGLTTGGYLAAATFPAIRGFPPILAALIIGIITVTATGEFDTTAVGPEWFARPQVRPIAFSFAAMLELVPPMLISVIAIQNLQGFTVLRQAGHIVPVNLLTVGCGYGSLAMGIFGSVPTCVTGPVNGILTTTQPPERRWAGGVVFGMLIGAFGLLAPLATGLASSMPPAFIAVLGGLAMLPVLNASFQSAFRGTASLGALVAFLVTVSEIKLLNIGAPFWGLVFGYIITAVLERDKSI